MQWHVLNGIGLSIANDNEKGSFFHTQEDSGVVP
jgi:hypothetical protein